MALARTLSVALSGVSGRLIEVRGRPLGRACPGLTFTGLADVSVMESRDRIRAAVLNSGFGWPNQRITVALLPADLRKNGSVFDLALAVAVLAAAGDGARRARSLGMVWLAELGLDGRLRPVRGVLPAVLAAREAGRADGWWCRPATPARRRWSAGSTVRAAGYLTEVVRCAAARRAGAAGRPSRARPPAAEPPPDLADVVGQPVARRALEIAAAGAHHLLLEGVPGAGKTMLAERLPSILPPLDTSRGAGGHRDPLGGRRAAGRRRPAPPAAAAGAAPHLVDGGAGRWRQRASAGPGAASLAHRGVLVLDEAAEFKPTVLDSLRQPLESGRVVLHRTGGAVEYPARFQLVLATNPCPCGARRTPTAPARRTPAAATGAGCPGRCWTGSTCGSRSIRSRGPT